MPVREIVGKSVAFGVCALGFIVGGILTLLGPHAYNDSFNVFLGWGLILLGLAAGGIGTLIVLFIVMRAREERRAHEVHVTPRQGAPGPPPAWGMGDIGRPGSGVVQVGQRERGGGGPMVMSVALQNWDLPVFLAGLVIWTIVLLVWQAPNHAVLPPPSH